MPAPRVFLSGILYDPETTLADKAIVTVELGPKTIRMQIDLEPKPVGDQDIRLQVALLLRELGEAIRHTEDVPLGIYTQHRLQT